MPQPPAILDHLGWRIAALVLCGLLGFALPYLALTQYAQSSRGSTPADTTTTAGTADGFVALQTPTLSASTASVSSPSASSSTTSAPTVPDDQAGSSAAALAAADEDCRLAHLRVQSALGAAEVSLAQFDKHIDAMNLLVAGKISYAVATQFWDETRQGATQNIAEFDRVERAFASAKERCKGLPPAVANQLPYGQVQSLNQCVSYVGRGRTALAAAHVAVTTWRHHVHDMEMLRMGHLTPAQATKAWRKNWHTGAKQLARFEAAQKVAAGTRCALT